MIEGFDALTARTTVFLTQDPIGPRSADFSKASPVSLLVTAVLLIVILTLSWDLLRHTKCLTARQKFAEAHGIGPFDSEAVDKAMTATEQRRGTE